MDEEFHLPQPSSGLKLAEQVPDAFDPEGALAGFGGFAVGALFGANPSAFRSFFLKKRLGQLERERDKLRKAGGPPLRVVYGGLADELQVGKRKPGKPPKDKRTLN